MRTKTIILLLVSLLCAVPAMGQTTEFTYQGKLNEGALTVTTPRDLRFRLWDSGDYTGGIPTGTQIGGDVVVGNVTFNNGIFTVQLDFGQPAFNGQPRWLEIAVSQPGANDYTTLTPLQKVTSAPYALKSLNADTAESATNSLQLGGVAASEFIQTTDSRLSDARDPNAGSASYIQNQNAGPQAASNFDISGTGRAAIFNAATQFDIGGGPALSFGSGVNNLHVGGTSPANTGNNQTFVGRFAGFANTTGGFNAFFGQAAGRNNTNGSGNSFFGSNAGFTIATGSDNSAFGYLAGQAFTLGNGNSMFGREAGSIAFTGSQNTFVGRNSDFVNVPSPTGSNNTLIGALTKVSSGVNNSTAIGIGAQVSTSNTIVLGTSAEMVRVPGFVAADFVVPNTGDQLSLGNSVSRIVTFGRIGIGTSFPTVPLHVQGRMQTSGVDAGLYFEDPGQPNAFWSWSAANPFAHLKFGSTAKLTVDVLGNLYMGALSFGASTQVCWNTSSGALSNCSSSARYKKDIADFRSGLDIVQKLRPVTFTWKNDGKPDLGFIAEETAEIEPLLTFKNKNGEIEGVNYGQISTVLVNAIKEQQEQIATQAKKIDQLMKLLCSAIPSAELCNTPEDKR